MIDQYCDDHPEASVAQGLMNTDSFERKLGSRAPLKCEEGYLPEGTDDLAAVCTARGEAAGVWVANGWCKCQRGLFNFLFICLFIGSPRTRALSKLSPKIEHYIGSAALLKNE